PRRYTDAYLVSPMIDLRQAALPNVPPSCVPPPVGPLGTLHPPQACPRQTLLSQPGIDPILLTIVHRFNRYDGVDGGRVEILEDAPQPGAPPAHATVVTPVRSVTPGKSDAPAITSY